MSGNQHLAALMREAGYLKDDGSVGLKVFARAASRHAGQAFTHTYVNRWLSGVVPRSESVRQAIADALGERLGRSVAVDELGFESSTAIPADLGLRYPSAVGEGVLAVVRLWQADLDNIQTLVAAPAHVGAWNEAALSWLVSASARLPESTGARRVGTADVAGVRATTALFERLDGQMGGGHARTALVEFLRRDLAPLLRGAYDEVTGRELFRAAASATMLAAWMSYDAGLHGPAQRYFVQALKFAESADDRLLAAGILDAMSHQATFLGNFREAANLARAALMGTQAAASPSLTAHFHIMEARALARVGDAAATDRAMAAAVREFERRRPDSDPDWFTYFDDAELAAEMGHCNRDLGRPNDATTYANQSAGANGEQVRSDFFVTMVLADAYLDQGDIEQACDTALSALEIGEQLKSARCVAYVDEFRQRLAPLSGSRAARDFVERARTARLWTPANARTVPNHGGSHRS